MGKDQWENWRPGQSSTNPGQGRNAPITQAEIESQIVQFVHDLEGETEAFERLSVDHAKKEASYKKAWFTDYIASEGTVKDRESMAGYKHSDLYMEAQVAEALMKAKRERLHAIRTSLDSLRTLAANVRAQT